MVFGKTDRAPGFHKGEATNGRLVNLTLALEHKLEEKPAESAGP